MNYSSMGAELPIFSAEKGAGVDAPPAPNAILAKHLAEARAGSLEAFEEVVELFHVRIYRFLLQLTRNPHDAEDLCQVTFLKAFKNLRQFDNAHSFSPWLFTIAKRTALNHFRDRKLTEELVDDHGVDHADPAAQHQSSEERDSLWALAKKLPQPQYEVLWLRYGEGFSVAETARIMNTNLIRVRVLLHRARSRLGTLIGHPSSKECR